MSVHPAHLALPLHRSHSAALLIAACAMSAAAQPQEVSRGDYVLRSSTVLSTTIDPVTAREHGIERSSSRGVLNVVVQRRGKAASGNVPAQVTAFARNLAGMEREVPMREAKAPNGWVSYIGTYEFAPREVLDFIVTARPRGSQTELSLKFRDRLPLTGS